MSSFKIKIDNLLKSESADSIDAIILDDSRNSNVSDIPLTLVNLKTISMVSCGLSSLQNFPALENLAKLDVSDNKIVEGLEALKVLKNLKQLLLSGNRIKSIDKIAPLAELEKLEVLDLVMCEINNMENYREEVFKLLPKLKYLDGEDQNGEEYEDSEESSDDEDAEEGLNMRDLLNADHSASFLDDEEAYVPKEGEDEDDDDEAVEDDASSVEEELTPDKGVQKAGLKRKVDDNEEAPLCKKDTEN